MVTFIVHYKKSKESIKRTALTRLHNDYLEDLGRIGKLLFFAEYSDQKRALFLLKCSSYQEVKKIIRDDPYIKCFYYQHYEINKMLKTDSADMNLLSDKNIINYCHEAI